MGYIVDGVRRGSNIFVEGYGYVRNHPLHLKPEHIKALKAKGYKIADKDVPNLATGEDRDAELAAAAQNDAINAANKQAIDANNEAALLEQMQREAAGSVK